jgi:BMFP domain-containing protein YqiC
MGAARFRQARRLSRAVAVLNASPLPLIVSTSSTAQCMRRSSAEVDAMTQTTNRFLDEFAKLMTDAAGAADGLRKEAETFFKAQGEKILRDMDVVRREEFEAVKAMAEKARAENERLEARILALETQLAQRGTA